eukprot:gene13103-3638_t
MHKEELGILHSQPGLNLGSFEYQFNESFESLPGDQDARTPGVKPSWSSSCSNMSSTTAPPATELKAHKTDHSKEMPVYAGDPDYEIPSGTLTETNMVNSGPALQLDRYGFIVSGYDSPEAIRRTSRSTITPLKLGSARRRGSFRAVPASKKEEESIQDRETHARRIKKWIKMLGPGGGTWGDYRSRKPEKVKRRLRKGIPPECRGLAWHVISGGAALMAKKKGRFEELQEDVDSVTDTIILRDLGRTYPHHVFFMDRKSIGQKSLYNVLRAYSAYDKEVSSTIIRVCG